jgi:predicted AAA+ superfamily ATPase
MFIARKMEKILLDLASGYPAVALLGPRQSGKTTLSQATFKDHRYISLENINERTFAQQDPVKFIKTNENEHGLILDEIQHVPELLSYIQTEIDAHDRPGYFILTGSQNFIVHQSVTQTLAGRVAILTLLPLSLQELKDAHQIKPTAEECVLFGGYPRIYTKDLNPNKWYINYVNTYIERDVRQITRVIDLSIFERFLKLCAGRIGQILNISALANECGVSHTTAKQWLSILQASYIIFLLEPYYKNFNKRLIKAPKLYFYDTGLACALLDLKEQQQLRNNFYFGALFESMIIAELFKSSYNKGDRPQVYFWRDNHGHEMDCVIEKGMELMPIEIKSGQTINPDFFKGLSWWYENIENKPDNGYLIYGGEQNQVRSKGNVLSWRSDLTDLT